MKTIKIEINLLLRFTGILLFFSSLTISAQDNAKYINPFIGTDHMGHTFPGALVPFGMVQLSPDTDTIPYSSGSGYNPDVYKYCAGYQYNDPTIVGFSHTHLHGTGHSDLGDFLIMPIEGKIMLNPGTADHPEKGYRSKYDKSTEIAKAGYYSVVLTKNNIKAELTATQRVGVHRYHFPMKETPAIILDMVHGIYNYDGKVVWSSLRVENDSTVTGYRQTNGWARDRKVYFALVFSKPIKQYGIINADKETYNGFWRRWKMDKEFPERSGKKIKAWFQFNMQNDSTLTLRLALSSVSAQGALKNLRTETPKPNFEKIKEQAYNAWKNEVNTINIEASDEEKRVFYTAMYHSLIHPSIYMDVDGQYRGLDQEIYKADGFTNYTIFSLWDTFRALHPWLTLTHPQETSDMVNSMLAHANQSVHKILPIWSHWSNDNWCMIGYHAVPVIADAMAKQIKGFNYSDALSTMVKSATYAPYEGLEHYMKYGFVAQEQSGSSASVTLEYAYDDYTISQAALLIGKNDIADKFAKRSLNYLNVFDPSTKFMRAKKSNGHFTKPFDALATHDMGYIEGNAWTYSLFVPHNPKKLIELYGGEKNFCNHLDSLFTMELPAKYYEKTEDIAAVGLMGNYVHGNEPGHHIPYLYNYAGKPKATQAIVRKILTTMYHNTPSGLCGNDDCGQMSAWFIFSSLGFYPVCPGTPNYDLGAPLYRKIELLLPNNNLLTIKANKLSSKNIYVKKVLLNGQEIKDHNITHQQILNGGLLEFEMTSEQ
ncbi:MAG: GH92 family glycosyl hydrolase [Sphingobacteriia bacterium]|nr:GH92 family glycosyl hydrolase [Sphingobacteriia bacterium]